MTLALVISLLVNFTALAWSVELCFRLWDARKRTAEIGDVNASLIQENYRKARVIESLREAHADLQRQFPLRTAKAS